MGKVWEKYGKNPIRVVSFEAGWQAHLDGGEPFLWLSLLSRYHKTNFLVFDEKVPNNTFRGSLPFSAIGCVVFSKLNGKKVRSP